MDRITKARTMLVQGQPFFGSLAVRLRPTPTDKVDTFGTDGKHLFYNEAFLAGLNDLDVQGVIAHEVLHVANCHHLRRGGRDKRRWNVACDYAINPYVVDAGFSLPEGALLNDAFRQMSAEQIYRQLPEGGDDGDDENGDDPGGCGGVLDSPSLDPKDPDNSAAAQEEADVQVAVAQAANIAAAAGQLPAFLKSMAETIKRGRVSWKDELKKWAQATSNDEHDWRRPNRRAMSRGIILPSLRGKRMGPMVVAIDTSGSCSSVAQDFLDEVSSIAEDLRPESVTVIYCDTAVQQVDVYEPHDLPITLDKINGGGTAFWPVFQYVAEQEIDPACLVYLTDLEGDSPADPGYPVLWASVARHPHPCGDVIFITD